MSTRSNKRRLLQDPRSTVDLCAEALTAGGENALYWCCVNALRDRGGSEVLEMAASLAYSAHAWERLLGIRVLAHLELGEEERPLAEGVLHGVLELESDVALLRELVRAIDAAGGEKSVPHLIELTCHSDRKVRLDALRALMGDESEPVLERLMELTQDRDPRVRDWATFALASSDVDTPELRRVLVYRMRDEDPEAQGEAMCGLACRGDSRVVEPLLLALAGRPNSLCLSAARMIADPRLHPALERLAARGDVDEDDLADALAACRPRKQ
jgi:HEAT repeat protein